MEREASERGGAGALWLDSHMRMCRCAHEEMKCLLVTKGLP